MRNQPIDKAGQRGLPAAGGTAEQHALPLLDMQRQIAQGTLLPGSIGIGYIFKPDHLCHPQIRRQNHQRYHAKICQPYEHIPDGKVDLLQAAALSQIRDFGNTDVF